MHKIIFSDLNAPISPRASSKSNKKTYEWLISQHIVKATEEEIPQKFIDGTLLCELLKKLSGRNPRLGYIPSPKTLSACRSNIRKALSFLGSFPKFKSEYLWSYEEIVHGDSAVVWGLLRDIMKFYPKYSSKKRTPKTERPQSAIPTAPEAISTLDINQVKIWLDKIGLRYLIDFSNCHFLKDPLKNGTLFCKVLNKIKGPFEYFNSPINIEEVWENINTAVWKIREEIKVSNLHELTEEKPAWNLLQKIMQNYKINEKNELPYSSDEINQLQHSIFKWVFSLKPFEYKIPENFSSLVKFLKSGIVLGNLYMKIFKKTLTLIKFPSSQLESLQNLEKILSALRNDPQMSQGYTSYPLEIYKGSQIYILALLEDLHRYSRGLAPRKIGEKYHQDGPFYGSFSEDNMNISRIEGRSPWNSGSCFMSPSRSGNRSSSFVASRNASPLSVATYSTFRNSGEMTYDNISPKVKSKKSENFSGFLWLAKIKIPLPRELDMTAAKISEFRNGEILGRILEVVEAKDIHGLQKAKKNSAAAKKNVGLVFDILRRKPSFSTQLYHAEGYILQGNGEYIRELLKEIYRIYKNSIVTLTKFNKTYRE